jgi:hypothetical protein
MRNQNPYLSSDELRELTKSGGSWQQIQYLNQLHIPFSLDAYGTPMVKRADLSSFRKARRQMT